MGVPIPRMDYNQTEKKIIIFSGAGLDQPSGIQTFRDSDGLWENHKIDDICTQSTWKKNFEAVHEFYNDRRSSLEKAESNEAHKTITRIMERYGKDNVFNITMNVSDFFERSNTNTLHLHGELTKMQCEACGQNWEIGYREWDYKTEKCPGCGSTKGVKPYIVFFGGQAPLYSYLHRAMDYTRDKDTIIVVIGTSNVVINVNNLLDRAICHKILIDVKVPDDMNEKIFDTILLNGAIDGMLEVEKIIDERWNNAKIR